ncbi:MAG: hypothetical protein ACTSYR_03975, partial [Candidatus Odinarchaeia archaeon]
LKKTKCVKVESEGKWYNTLENLTNVDYNILFPRGHPYTHDVRIQKYYWEELVKDSVLNMGLWSNHLDLDALTLIYHGGLNGRGPSYAANIKRDKIIVGKGNYFSICSMNTSFVRKIIPAFYQLYMNYTGIDRFDDIWSGLFIKKIADELGDAVSLGTPLVLHNKRPRDSFKDLKLELEGMRLNEVLWKIVDNIDLECSDYFTAYESLIKGLNEKISFIQNKQHKDYIKFQLEKMSLWLKVIEKIS